MIRVQRQCSSSGEGRFLVSRLQDMHWECKWGACGRTDLRSDDSLRRRELVAVVGDAEP